MVFAVLRFAPRQSCDPLLVLIKFTVTQLATYFRAFMQVFKMVMDGHFITTRAHAPSKRKFNEPLSPDVLSATKDLDQCFFAKFLVLPF